MYSGIDLVYSGTEGHLKSTYLVAAGADPTQIGWRYQGHTQAVIDPTTGDLVLTLPTPPGRRGDAVTLREQAPIAWQTNATRRIPVDVRYTLGANGRVGFALGTYDHARPLIIDPALSYSTYLGGSGDDGVAGIALDRDDNLYVVGNTYSADFPVTGSGLQTTSATNIDITITKLSPDGQTILYSTYLGGANDDLASGIAVDQAGNAVVAGRSNSTDYPTQASIETFFDSFEVMLVRRSRLMPGGVPR